MSESEAFIKTIPKAELHCHIEGTLEPELLFELAKRNKIALSFDTPEQARQAYDFDNLQSFLDLYYQGAKVLVTEQDFYDLTWSYLQRIKQDNVVHTEIFFDPQTHTQRGIPFDTIVNGIDSALKDAEKNLSISSKLILCFLRDLGEQAAYHTLKQAIPHKDKIVAVGLDSAEIGHPPERFQHVFEGARNEGWLSVAHAGEEGPASYMWQAIELLKVSRIDHGIQCDKDRSLLTYLREKQIPLTVCPLSNIKLKIFPSLETHNLKTLLDKGLCVTINSDDPAYFGGYIVDNYIACQKALGLSQENIRQLAINSFQASFLDSQTKEKYIKEIQTY